MTTLQRPAGPGKDPRTASELIESFYKTRAFTEKICAPMETEDYVIQSMADVSPTKWHLAHTTWFFEAFLLNNSYPHYEPLNLQYNYLFNSYYNAIGDQFCRPRRGQISRPTVKEVYEYRQYVTEKVVDLVRMLDADDALDSVRPTIILGINHEQQHQELMVTDIKHVLSMNPLRPALFSRPDDQAEENPTEHRWLPYEGGLREVGYDGPEFHFDNESKRHRVYLEPFEIGSRLVTNREFTHFMADGGYQRPDLWLALGWAAVQEASLAEHDWEKLDKPLYWFRTDFGWMQYTLAGPRLVDPDEPVTHVSYFEADAYARWSGVRLPSEEEWEVASADSVISGGNFSGNLQFHPRPLASDASMDRPQQMFGDVWEWTRSSYSAYPGFRPWEGAAGEYNGKFMADQLVLRGGSCATPEEHIRPSYRNFFPAPTRWQFSGIRLARDAG